MFRSPIRTLTKGNSASQGKSVLLTFGLLGRSKGVETVIQALPEIIERFPNVVFLVVGATHPNVVRQEGESYRLSLQGLARELGVEKNVVFYNRFVDLDELMEFLSAADIYVTPYLNQDQITSGTLAYALGAGKAVVSTPYWHAEELLADGSGILVPFAAPDALAHAIIHLLEDEGERDAIRKQAYLAGRKMTWPVVARQYMESFRQARQARLARPRSLPAGTRVAAKWDDELPPLDLSHLLRMTDDVGMLQHAVASVPNYTRRLHHGRQRPGLAADRFAGRARRPVDGADQWVGQSLSGLLVARLQFAKRSFPQLHVV